MILNIFMLLKNCSIFVLLIISSIYEKDSLHAGSLPPFTDIEQLIRSKYDSYAVFNWDQYAELLAKLSQEKFAVLPINEMRNTFDNTRIIVGLRHDVDFNPFKALEMAKIERLYGIRASYYMLATAEYYGNINDSQMIHSAGIGNLFMEIHNTGAEIGIHNDLLTVLILNNIDPILFNKEELKFFKSLRIPIYGTAAHGSPLAKRTAPNYEVFSDFALKDSVKYEGKKYLLGLNSLKEYGFKYEAYHIDYGIYLSESGGKWNDPDGFDGILKKLESSIPGDRIQILVHPDWWGKPSD